MRTRALCGQLLIALNACWVFILIAMVEVLHTTEAIREEYSRVTWGVFIFKAMTAAAVPGDFSL